MLAESDLTQLGQVNDEAQGTALAAHVAKRPPVVGLEIEGHRLGTLVLGDMVPENRTNRADRSIGERVSRAGTVDGGVGTVAEDGTRRADVVRFLYLLGDTIGQVCRQGYELRGRLDELTTLFELSTLLAEQRELSGVLDTVVRALVKLMGAKAAAIRLLNDTTKELAIGAVHNLSKEYLSKGPILASHSEVDRLALEGDVVYVGDMGHDDRVMYPQDAERAVPRIPWQHLPPRFRR